MYTEKLCTSQILVSNATVVSGNAALLLFGGPLTALPSQPPVLAMRSAFYKFKMDEDTQHLLLNVRRHIDSLLDTKLANPRQDLSAAVAALVRALNSVLRCTGVVEEQGDSESEEEAEVEGGEAVRGNKRRRGF